MSGEFQSPLHRGTSSDSEACRTLPLFSKVSIPSSSGHVIGQQCKCTTSRLISEFQSPLHRGRSSDRNGCPALDEKGKFQSPLHRGRSSDVRVLYSFTQRVAVSIPSSSGQVIGLHLPNFEGGIQEVSIPSSSGQVIGRRGNVTERAWATPCFNPLFIGAGHRTAYRGNRGIASG